MQVKFPVLGPPAALTSLPSGAALRALLDREGELLVVLDAQARIAWCNAAFASAVGIPAERAFGRALRDFLHSDTDASAEAAFDQGLAGKADARSLEVALSGSDGEPLWCELRATPFEDASGAGFACMLRDHRALRRERAQARRLAELLDLVQEFGRLGVWEREIATGEGRWDRHVFRFFGLDPAGGTPTLEQARPYIHPDDRARLGYEARLKMPGRYAQRYRVIAPDGSTRVVHSQWEVKADEHGAPTYAIGVMLDDTEVYEMARSLADANARYDLAAELAGIGLWRHDLKTDRVHYDDRTYDALGLAPQPEGLPLEMVRSLIHPDDLPDVLASAKHTLETGESTDIEARYRHSDGGWRYVLTRRALQRAPDGTPVAFVGVGIDITERVQATRRAVDLARRLETITRASGLGVWSMSGDADGSRWNEKMFELFGLPQADRPPGFEELLRSRVHPDDRERLRRDGGEWIRGVISTPDIEYRIVLPDGSIRWLLNRADVNRSSGPPRLYGVTMDVTELKRTEAALQEARERVALATRGTGIGTWVRDMVTDVTYWDEQMFLLRGWAPQAEAPGLEEALAIVHPEDRKRVIDTLSASRQSDEPVGCEFRVQLPDGQWRWLASRSLPVRDGEGRVVRQTGVNWDVTEAHVNELERQERIAAQRESEAKSQFLARMSHELRTPLNAVLGFTQLTLADGERIDAATRRKRLEHIRTAGEHLLSLIDDMLDLANLQSGDLKMSLEPVRIEALLRETLPLLSSSLQMRKVALQCGALEGVVWADPDRLRQSLIILLSKAVKYGPAGGRVLIETAGEGRYVTLKVHAMGAGLDKGKIGQLFEPLGRPAAAPRDATTASVGIAVVRTVIERMGGRITAAEDADTGSEFTIALEDASGAESPVAAPLDASAEPELPSPGYQGQLLYIEDNPVNVLIVEELVANCPGLKIASEPTGERGVDRAKSLKPDLVLVDMQLPDFDGYEVLRRLRADPATTALRCVALSANAIPEDIDRALSAGFSDYWTKPIDFRAFMASLDALFAKRG